MWQAPKRTWVESLQKADRQKCLFFFNVDTARSRKATSAVTCHIISPRASPTIQSSLLLKANFQNPWMPQMKNQPRSRQKPPRDMCRAFRMLQLDITDSYSVSLSFHHVCGEEDGQQLDGRAAVELLADVHHEDHVDVDQREKRLQHTQGRTELQSCWMFGLCAGVCDFRTRVWNPKKYWGKRRIAGSVQGRPRRFSAEILTHQRGGNARLSRTTEQLERCFGTKQLHPAVHLL